MRLIDKVANLSPRTKLIAKISISIISSICLVWGTTCAMSKQVSIVDDTGEKISFITYANNTADVLSEQNVTLGKYDEASIPLDGSVKDGDTIYVYRGKAVTFVDGKESSTVITPKQTVEEFLKSKGVNVDSDIRTNVALTDKIVKDMVVAVTYLSEKTVTVEETVIRGTKRVANASMYSGQSKVSKEGSDGLADRVYKEYYENGDLVGRELVKEDVKIAAVDDVVEYGTKARSGIQYGGVISRGSDYRYKQCLTVSCTAYTGGYRTAAGMVPRYGIVAVDPRVIPMGSRLYIESADGSWVYGTAVAGDTGGAIKGNIVDLYVNSYSEAINFGRRTAKVYILE